MRRTALALMPGNVRAQRLNPRRAGLVAQQTIHTFPHEVLLPALDARSGGTSLEHENTNSRQNGDVVTGPTN